MLCMPVVIVAGVCWFFVACHVFVQCVVCVCAMCVFGVHRLSGSRACVGSGVGLVVWCDKL